MRLWSAKVRSATAVRTSSFVDDRVVWRLVTARQASDEFDNIVGFSCRPEKCAIGPTSANGEQLAQLTGDAVSSQLAVLA